MTPRGVTRDVLAALLPARAAHRFRTRGAMRDLTSALDAALREQNNGPSGVRELCRALCEEMSERRGRRVELRFERFPDEIEVTGLWVEFHEFDLVIVEERAEAVQQLVILGHELWHLHAGHCHHHSVGATAARVLADEQWGQDRALAVAARNGSRKAEEADAEEFGHRLATVFRPWVEERKASTGSSGVQASLGYRGRGSGNARR
ncbi:toxin-antitoxin system, toxin component family protein [Streptomyces sp. ADMS]|uniref:toxin-antitoxin system, toxin component family protein n=1 Tax=Streptomyces sp. ADMS TaxID=3071415 RepID=UPI00296EA05C|nr:toxin-antitoxin system, toxin component family protein [Streptomyces sp. ADMS]MDW4910172.1 toxin-antitoxin system, toxin component family protein [Streptomyces sp. ADMS]